jgi:hypothetical protein
MIIFYRDDVVIKVGEAKDLFGRSTVGRYPTLHRSDIFEGFFRKANLIISGCEDGTMTKIAHPVIAPTACHYQHLCLAGGGGGSNSE